LNKYVDAKIKDDGMGTAWGDAHKILVGKSEGKRPLDLP
jgi:hypothetical protein